MRRLNGLSVILGRWARRALPLLVVLMVGIAVHAQETRPVTYDDINDVARQMFCPECENIPLDKCFTTVCIQWKQEIGEQLAAGISSDDIVAGFVARFGDQVVGVPQDPFLRNLALIAPVLFVILSVAIGGYAIWSRLQRQTDSEIATDSGLRTAYMQSVQPTGDVADYPDKDSDTSEHPVESTPQNPVGSPSYAAKSASATKSDAKYLAQLEQDVDRD